MGRKYVLELTEEQARALSDAAELYARLMIGQMEALQSDLPDSPLGHFIARANVDENPLNADGHIIRDIDSALGRVKELVTGLPPNASHGIHSPKVPDKARVLWDIHHVIRYHLHRNAEPVNMAWGVWCCPPMKVSSTSPLATIRSE